MAARTKAFGSAKSKGISSSPPPSRTPDEIAPPGEKPAAPPAEAKKSRLDQLSELDEMKKQGKVTNREYKILREKIINGE